MRGRTTFAIAHRLSTILRRRPDPGAGPRPHRGAGHPRELLRRNGLYARLYAAQFQNEETGRTAPLEAPLAARNEITECFPVPSRAGFYRPRRTKARQPRAASARSVAAPGSGTAEPVSVTAAVNAPWALLKPDLLPCEVTALAMP